MAKSINRAQLLGRLGRDPEVRDAGSGRLAGLSLAVSRRAKKDGQVTEETDWFRVVCWGKLAETAERYLKKGDRVYVEGRLQPRKITGRDGVEKTVVEIIASDLVMLSEKQEAAVPVKQPFGEDEFDDDLGF